jgi:hypothetical protein
MGFAEFMQLAGVLVPIGGGFAWLAYKHPDEYGRLASFLTYKLGSGIGVAYFCYCIGFQHGSEPKAKIAVEPWTFFFWFVGISFFLTLLTGLKALGFSDVSLKAKDGDQEDRQEQDQGR